MHADIDFLVKQVEQKLILIKINKAISNEKINYSISLKDLL
jgi:hypothetical protein